VPARAWGFKSPLRHVFCATRNRNGELGASSRRVVRGGESQSGVKPGSVVLVGVFEEPPHSAEPVDDCEGLVGGERCGSRRGELLELRQGSSLLARGFGDPRCHGRRVGTVVESGPVLGESLASIGKRVPSLVGSRFVGGIVRGCIDDRLSGAGGMLGSEEFVQLLVERFDERLLSHVHVDGMVDGRAGSAAPKFAAVVAAPVALVRPRHAPAADRASNAPSQEVSRLLAALGSWLAALGRLDSVPVLAIDERLVRGLG
jgi:hypothetical protein